MLCRALAAVAALTLAAPAAAAEGTPLKDVERVREGIIAVGMALKIEEQCEGIDARRLRGLLFLQGLKSHAEDLGYSAADIDAYLSDREEEMRLRAIATDRLAALGAVEGDPASYCAAGRAEIARESQVGRLLR